MSKLKTITRKAAVWVLTAALTGSLAEPSVLSVMAAEQTETTGVAETGVPGDSGQSVETETAENNAAGEGNPNHSGETAETGAGGTTVDTEAITETGTGGTAVDTEAITETGAGEAAVDTEATTESGGTGDFEKPVETEPAETDAAAESGGTENPEMRASDNGEETDFSGEQAEEMEEAELSPVKAAPAQNPYYQPDPGTALPASPSGSTPAEPYIFADKTLTPGLFSNTTQYRAIFKEPAGISDYGTVTFENNGVQYTPSAEVAGRTVKFLVQGGDNSGQWTDGIEFTVQVGQQPTDAGNNANLSGLSYQVGSGEWIPVPEFSSDTLAYTVRLPEGTALNQTIRLQGTLADSGASVTYGTAVTGWEADASEATAVVTAENQATKKTYTVKFYVKPKDQTTRIYFASGETWKDGDTIWLNANEEKRLYVSLGAGDTAAESVTMQSSDLSVLHVSQGQWGVYPFNQISCALKLANPDASADLTISFYHGRFNEDPSLAPYETITLHIRSRVARPDAPTYDDLSNGDSNHTAITVTVQCVEQGTTKKCYSTEYKLMDNGSTLSKYGVENYHLGEITWDETAGEWYCDVTIDAEAYIKSYSASSRGNYTLHQLISGESPSKVIRFRYKKNSKLSSGYGWRTEGNYSVPNGTPERKITFQVEHAKIPRTITCKLLSATWDTVEVSADVSQKSDSELLYFAMSDTPDAEPDSLDFQYAFWDDFIFEELTPGKTYYFWAKIPANSRMGLLEAVSQPLEVTLPKKPLTLNQISVDWSDSVYSGSTAMADGAIQQFELSGLQSGDTAVLGKDYKVTGVFETPDAGEGKNITYTLEWLNEELASKYEFAPVTRSDGNIKPAVPQIQAGGALQASEGKEGETLGTSLLTFEGVMENSFYPQTGAVEGVWSWKDADQVLTESGEYTAVFTPSDLKNYQTVEAQVVVSVHKHMIAPETQEWKQDANQHWYECSCGDKLEIADHVFKWVTDREATSQQTGLKHEECETCGYRRAEVEIPVTEEETNQTESDQTESDQTESNQTETGETEAEDSEEVTEETEEETKESGKDTKDGNTKNGNSNEKTTTATPQTGDLSHWGTWAALMLASAMAAAAGIFGKRKKKSNGKR